MKSRFFTIIFLAAFWPVCMQAQRTYGGNKPNIILIVADDLGYGDLGCYGQQKIRTPHIDAMAAEGIKFTQFYSGTSVCAPSRASLMTGLHTGHTAVRGNRGFQPEGQFPLPEGTTTFPQLLQEMGYNTAAFGKWGLGYPESTGVPEKQGFREFYGYLCQSQAHNYYPDHVWHNGTRIDWPFNIGRDSLYSGDVIQQKALDFINAPHEQPYFLFLPYTLPHGDLDVPRDSVYENYVKQFNEQPVPKPAKPRNAHDRYEPYPHAAFAAMVARLDRYVGEIRKQVKLSGQESNTLIIFTSDNGPHREDGGDPEFFNSSGGLRGIKRDLYEGGIRVPMIASWKKTIKPGITHQTAAFWDFFPTFLDLAGLPFNQPIDGISFVPTLMGKGKQAQHSVFYWEFHENNGRQAVRMGKWKGVQYKASLELPDAIELYDLEKDPFEKNNIAARYPEVVMGMKAVFKNEHRYNKEWPLLYGEAAVSR